MSKLERKPSPNIAGRIGDARGGDENALEEVIRYYQDRIAGFVASQVGREIGDFEDLCQMVFVKMALALPRLRSVDVFEPWVFRIARNVCRDHLRRRRWRALFVPLSRDHEAIASDQPAGAEAESRELAGAIKKLSGSQRKLIDLLCGREYSYAELARLTGSSERAVAGRLFRARSRLRKLLGYAGAER